MKSLQQVSMIILGMFLFLQVGQAQCFNSNWISGSKNVCENNYSTYVFAYDSSGTLNFDVVGGTIVGSMTTAPSARMNQVAIRILWDSTPGVSMANGSLTLIKTTATCRATEEISICIHDSTSGFCS